MNYVYVVTKHAKYTLEGVAKTRSVVWSFFVDEESARQFCARGNENVSFTYQKVVKGELRG